MSGIFVYFKKGHYQRKIYSKTLNTCIRNRVKQTMQIQIRLFLKEQSDQCLGSMTKHRTTKHRKAEAQKRQNIERLNIEKKHRKKIEKRSK